MKPKYVADSNDVPDIVEERNPVNGLQHTYCGWCRQGDFNMSDPVWKIVRYTTGTVSASDGVPEGGTVTARMFPDGSMLYNKAWNERENYAYTFHL